MYKRIRTLVKYSRTSGIKFLFFGILIKSVIEVIGVASITPFVSVMINPGIVDTNQYLNSASRCGQYWCVCCDGYNCHEDHQL